MLVSWLHIVSRYVNFMHVGPKSRYTSSFTFSLLTCWGIPLSQVQVCWFVPVAPALLVNLYHLSDIYRGADGTTAALECSQSYISCTHIRTCGHSWGHTTRLITYRHMFHVSTSCQHNDLMSPASTQLLRIHTCWWCWPVCTWLQSTDTWFIPIPTSFGSVLPFPFHCPRAMGPPCQHDTPLFFTCMSQ